MKIYNRYLISAFILLAGAGACSEDEMAGDMVLGEEQTEVSGNLPETISGELLVRFDQSVIDIIEKEGLAAGKVSSPLTRSGVLGVDEVLSLVGTYQIERVFPVDVRTEDAARKSGLHLWYVVRFSKEHSAAEVAADLAKLGEVSRVEYNRTLKRANIRPAKPLSVAAMQALAETAGNPVFNDELLPKQWHLVNDGNLGATKFIGGCDVNVENAWKTLSSGDPSIIVAVLDEGVDYSHPDLKDAMWINEDEIWRSHEDNDSNGYAGDLHGYNFVQDSGVISCDNVYDTGHGSHVAGVIAATNNNGIGISSIAGGDGVNPGVRIMSCQIFSGNYAGTLLDEVRAIKYAADNGAVVLQCSWGYTSGAANPYDWVPEYSTDDEWMDMNVLERKALDYFIHNAGSPDGVIDGGIAVFAGGNEYAPAAGYPGAYGDFVSVAAVAADYTPAVYTNYGGGTTISAPGGDQDYYYEYGEGLDMGTLGCILSTLPAHVSESGYGYMEGTSMACPHVSGVIALGLSYAAQKRLHFKADEIKELLYATALPFDNDRYWNLESPKMYYKYVADLGQNHPQNLDLNDYVGKMGHGMVDAETFLNAIAGSGVAMTFPNVYIAVGGKNVMMPSRYLDGDSFEIVVTDETVATAKTDGNTVIFEGLKEGQTSATIKGSSRTDTFMITVRDSANGNGWL